MQSKTTRGVRRLLVSTGVISLVLSGLAPAALAEKPADRKVWVCHGTGSETNPYEINLVSVNAEGHHGEELDDEALLALADAGVTNKGDLNRLSASALEELIGATCGGEGGDEEGGEREGDDAEVVVVTPPGGGAEEAPGGVVPDTDQPTKEPAPSDGESGPTEEQPAPIISSTKVERPAPAAPARPAAPAVPSTPVVPAPEVAAAPVAPARSVVTSAPTTPVASVAVPATSGRNEVLGSVTTRTPGGATVTALAATGASTTVTLAALGTVLLLAGLGLQVGARRRVRSSDVGA